MTDFVTRLHGEWQSFVMQVIPQLEQQRLTLPDNTKVGELKTGIDEMANNVESIWGKGAAAEFYSRSLKDVRELSGTVTRMLELQDPHIKLEAEKITRGVDSHWEEIEPGRAIPSKFSEEMQQRDWASYQRILQKRQRSLESVEKLCEEFKRVDDFVIKAKYCQRHP